jgi:hypothetical protein
MIATPASLRFDFIHIVGMAIYIAPESTNHITGIRSQGLTASTSIPNTGLGFNYFPYLHIGATAWYLMGAQGTNPLQLLG